MSLKIRIPQTSSGKRGNKLTPINRKKRGRRVSITLSLVIAAVILTSGVYYYQASIAPFRHPVLTVDGNVVRMGYFLKRVKIADGDDAATIQQLLYEEIVKEVAPLHGIEASEADVYEALHDRAIIANNGIVENASQVTVEITNSSFEDWYNEQLTTTGLSDAEYREIIRINLLATRLQKYMAGNIPMSVEQVRLSAMALATKEDAEKARTRIVAGEPFATVASEASIDPLSKANGGDLGWIPRGVIPYDDVVFQLSVGELSGPVMLDTTSPATSQYALFLISERDSDRIIEDYMLQVLGHRAFYDWLEQEIPKHLVEYDYGPETQAWVKKQIAKVIER